LSHAAIGVRFARAMARADAPDIDALIAHLPLSLQPLARRGAPRSYRKGTVIIEEGSLGDALYLLLAGRVKAFSDDARGREVVYGVYGPGEYFGEMSLDGGPRSASVMAVETIVCAMVARQTLRDHIVEHPDFAFELIARVIRRARMATTNARNMALLDVYGRVVQLLDGLAQPAQLDGSRVVSERLTHGDIAARVGCSREMVSRLLKDLERGGYVEAQRGLIVIRRALPARW
jgi:CRP/FNR family transcriptional regulator, cyclic AMP receptor protein